MVELQRQCQCQPESVYSSPYHPLLPLSSSSNYYRERKREKRWLLPVGGVGSMFKESVGIYIYIHTYERSEKCGGEEEGRLTRGMRCNGTAPLIITLWFPFWFSFYLFIYLYILVCLWSLPFWFPWPWLWEWDTIIPDVTRKINKVRGNQLGGSIVAGPRTSTCRLCTHMTFPPFASSLLPSPFFLNLNF